MERLGDPPNGLATSNIGQNAQGLRKAIYKIIILAVWELAQLVKKKIQTSFLTQKFNLACVDGIKHLK